MHKEKEIQKQLPIPHTTKVTCILGSIDEARDYINEHYVIEANRTEVAGTGCMVENYETVSK